MSAIRALRQLTSASCQVATRLVLPSGQTLLVAQRVSHTSPSPSATRVFSTTPSRFLADASDVVFLQKLAEELKFEKKSAQPGEPEFLKSFKAEGVWTIEDAEGDSMVTLTRTFGNENILLRFSTFDDENIQATAGFKRTAGEGQEDLQSYPIRMLLVNTKDGAASLRIYIVCQGGMFATVDFPDGTKLPAEADWKQHRFDTLRVLVGEEWLNERGVNESLATFIPEYVKYKEKKEYVRWLEKMKRFVEA